MRQISQAIIIGKCSIGLPKRNPGNIAQDGLQQQTAWENMWVLR